MVLFDGQGHVAFGLDEYTNNSDVASEIRKSAYSEGGTDIAAGMHTALTEVFAEVSNRDVRKVMIVITDGDDNSNVTAERAVAEENDIITYAVGVGEGTDHNKLIEVAGNPKRVYTFDNYDALASAIDQLCTDIVISPAPRGCKCNTAHTWLDLIFVIDSSKAVNKQDFMAVRNFAAAFIQSIPVSQEIGKFSRVGIINMGDQAQVVGELTSYNTTDQAANAMRNMPYLNSNQANLRDALNKATNMLDSDHDHRQNVQNVIVLFSSVNEPCNYQGYSRLLMKFVDHNPCRIAAQLRQNNNIILTVGLKYDGIEKYPVLNVGSDCYKLNFDAQLPENFVNAICRANCYCLPPYVQFTDKCTEYGECVYQQDQPLDFLTAELTCQNYNATMIDVLSAEKDLFIRDMQGTRYSPYWIGAQYSNNQYKWATGIELDTDGYKNWASGEPDIKKGECVYENINGNQSGWFSDRCDYFMPTHYFVCQKKSCMLLCTRNPVRICSYDVTQFP
ncbi:unnamed protein product [Anisakis simplex]|uniref:C-type lectin n=1 Tax=Anisakis simplex TaxID=6269 RepID=A0A0M3K6H5_ANISI|nr:unnamed protein product [Anisakis simplex]